jgi:hypothetical protein
VVSEKAREIVRRRVAAFVAGERFAEWLQTLIG